MAITIPSPDPVIQARRDAFMGWQCRVRQMMMRDDLGRPGPAIMPEVWLSGAAVSAGQIITVMSKRGSHSRTPEFQHMVKRTHDPASRREAALKLLSEFYFQKPDQFSDMLTASFQPGSTGAAAIRAAGTCRLAFAAFGQKWDLHCRVWGLAQHHPLWQATYWHNKLFNPGLTEEAVILGFEPDWSRTTADPAPSRAPN